MPGTLNQDQQTLKSPADIELGRRPGAGRTPISVLILTKNEAEDIHGCLASVAWADDVHVFDAFSEDATVLAAEAFGATITQRAFDGFSAQRNAALASAPFRNPWVLMLDADERIPESLAKTLTQFVAAPPPGAAACRIGRREFFLGRRVARISPPPHAIRLVRPGKVRYERLVDETVQVDGCVSVVAGAIEHHPFGKGTTRWIERHGFFAALAARQILEDKRGQSLLRRIWTSAILPLRPVTTYLRIVIVRGALFDGAAGLTYAGLHALYEYLIYAKTREVEADVRSESAKA